MLNNVKIYVQRKGFTLLEVLIVVIILSVLIVAAWPQFVSTIERSKSGEAVSNITGIRVSLDRYWYKNGSITTDLNNLETDNPNSVTDRLYSYSIEDDGTDSSIRRYTITATRTADSQTYWVRWTQTDNDTGGLTKSANLGGPES